MTIEERATQLATHESFEGNIVHTYTDNGEKAMYIAVLKEQQEIDIQQMKNWIEALSEYAYLEGPQWDTTFDRFQLSMDLEKFMKGE